MKVMHLKERKDLQFCVLLRNTGYLSKRKITSMKLVSILREPVEQFGEYVIDATRRMGDYTLMVVQFLGWMWRPPYRWRLLLQQMEFVGVQSLSIIMLTTLFSGMIAALQGSYVAYLFNAQGMVGSAVALGTTREGAPVLCALMIVGRCGSAMAAELGTMRVTEQIDALESMAVNPIQYLVVPRVMATLIMLPILTVIGDIVAIFGSWIVMVRMQGVDSGIFFENIRWFIDPLDIYMGLIKALAFGFALSTIGCFQGFTTTGGAKGVGNATTRSVVVASVTILVMDYFLGQILHMLEMNVFEVL